MLEVYKGFASLNDRCKYILRIIQENGPVTKNELINITKLKLTTLNHYLMKKLLLKVILENLQEEENLVYMI